MTRLLVLGGTRSGKSRYALERARALGGDGVTFIATARAGDPELDARIAAHRAQRPPAWTTREVAADLAAAVVAADPRHVLLVDSLTLWAAAVVEAEGTLRPRWAEAARALERRDPAVVLVSDEVGMGVIPLGELSRRFVDELGWLEQQAAAACDEVRLMVAGIPLRIKGTENGRSA
ncbi:MAG: bifunctional adenosylcobinamide kinase/adenosylcobinamide-phosphate guanylyltransferase [Chloroflexota bacterium]|nr:bifunctional adenosylcobinamide kinase/adenosylcobinamide-phosphate guanylyltransferase [Chloroflexota bacterium]